MNRPYTIQICECEGKFAWVRSDGEIVSEIHDSLESALADTKPKTTEKERLELNETISIRNH